MKVKTVYFAIDLPEPTREQVLGVPCTLCNSLVGERCYRENWHTQKRTYMSKFHHNRLLSALKIQVTFRAADGMEVVFTPKVV